MVATIAAMSLVPAGPAGACPDPDNPCDPDPSQYDFVQIVQCRVLKKNC
ncbi:MAG TPA: hypothetical protein VNC78_00640 [Actinomycetota bacterium]|nr:hypothetical protein [Actinomycetota bacterium]